MGKKIVSLITLICFVIFIQSCGTVSVKKEQLQELASKGERQVRTIGLVTTSGEFIELSKEYPAIISEDDIYATIMKTVEIDEYDVKNIVQYAEREMIPSGMEIGTKGKISEIETKDGKRYRVREIKDGKYICDLPESFFMSLSKIETLWIERSIPVWVAIVGLTVLVVIIAIAATSGGGEGKPKPEPPPPPEPEPKPPEPVGSCPYIYSFNGENFVLDAQPYGGAICQALNRTEWCGLEHLKEVNGQYMLLITNEANETQYTDELKLVIVDHPKEVKVVPDIFGRIHTFSQPITPLRAYDGKGRDLLSFVSKDDRVFWQTRLNGRDFEKREELRDELIFEFPKPKGAKRAKLWVNAGTTSWGSEMGKRILDLQGNRIIEWYNEVNTFGPAFQRLISWFYNEELYLLQIRMETKDGWESKGVIYGSGPLISEDKAYVIDISDVPDDTLKIKLLPPLNFWTLNYIAIDYTEDSPIETKEIEAVKAVDSIGEDMRGILEENDKNYFIMPNMGDKAELVFEAPPKKDDMERSAFLKANGYYDIHLERKGKPQTEIFERILNEPGFTGQYALQEYLKWKQESVKKK